MNLFEFVKRYYPPLAATPAAALLINHLEADMTPRFNGSHPGPRPNRTPQPPPPAANRPPCDCDRCRAAAADPPELRAAAEKLTEEMMAAMEKIGADMRRVQQARKHWTFVTTCPETFTYVMGVIMQRSGAKPDGMVEMSEPLFLGIVNFPRTPQVEELFLSLCRQLKQDDGSAKAALIVAVFPGPDEAKVKVLMQAAGMVTFGV